MSKMDDLRAMREARYEQMSSRASKPNAAPTKPELPAPRSVEAAPVEDSTEPVGALLCGHRAISGRTCTREQGHAAKSHRYS
jgi:hypothetical protein